MRQFTMFVLALVLLAVPAAADDRHGRNTGRHGGDGHDYDRGTEIAALSHQLVRTTQRVHQRAERAAHHPGRREARALGALHELEAEARRFHARVDAGRLHPRRDLDRLERAYRRAERRLPLLHPVTRVRRDFARVGQVMRELRLSATYASKHRHGRYAQRSRTRSPWFHGVFAWR
jgi:hypothetical protein